MESWLNLKWKNSHDDDEKTQYIKKEKSKKLRKYDNIFLYFYNLLYKIIILILVIITLDLL